MDETCDRIASEMGCEPDNGDDLVEAVRLLVQERDAERERFAQCDDERIRIEGLLAAERAKVARLEEERAATCLALTGGLNVVLPGKLPDLVRGIYERIEVARKAESAQRARDGIHAMLRQVDAEGLIHSSIRREQLRLRAIAEVAP